MERRSNERTQVHFEAKVTTLTAPEQSTLGRVSDLSKSGVSVVLPWALPTGARVHVEMADSVLFGRVVYSNSEGSLFRVGFEVDRIELGSSSLAAFLQETLIQAMPGLPGLESSNTPLY